VLWRVGLVLKVQYQPIFAYLLLPFFFPLLREFGMYHSIKTDKIQLYFIEYKLNNGFAIFGL
jgi:hypothetical protein